MFELWSLGSKYPKILLDFAIYLSYVPEHNSKILVLNIPYGIYYGTSSNQADTNLYISSLLTNFHGAQGALPITRGEDYPEVLTGCEYNELQS